MKAGRELDALVAEKLMGLELVRHGGNIFYKEQSKHHPIELLLPEYSSFIAQAWLVVEKMKRDGMLVIIKADGLRIGDFSHGWTVLIDNHPRVDADTAPLAICKAALRTIGYEVPA